MCKISIKSNLPVSAIQLQFLTEHSDILVLFSLRVLRTTDMKVLFRVNRIEVIESISTHKLSIIKNARNKI